MDFLSTAEALELKLQWIQSLSLRSKLVLLLEYSLQVNVLWACIRLDVRGEVAFMEIQIPQWGVSRSHKATAFNEPRNGCKKSRKDWTKT
jgi:hypothetical protein